MWWKDEKFPVLYLFNVNGAYVGSREEARATLNKNLFRKFSYFCKIEWKFFNVSSGIAVRRGSIYTTKEEAMQASQKLLGVILPILEREHWPVWER